MQSEICECIDAMEEHLPIHSDEGDPEEDVVRRDPTVKHNEAIHCFGTCVQWAGKNSNDWNSLSILRMMRERAMQVKQYYIKQTKLLKTEFLKS